MTRRRLRTPLPSSMFLCRRVQASTVGRTTKLSSFRKLDVEGFPLAEGSFFWRMHKQARDSLDQALVYHGGKILVLVSCFTLDWTTLRCVLIGSSLASISFQGTFPLPRPTRMAWGVIFALGHAYSLMLHLREHWDWPLEPTEAKVYAQHFKPYGGCSSI
jgi:hypothetical protein